MESFIYKLILFSFLAIAIAMRNETESISISTNNQRKSPTVIGLEENQSKK